MTRSHEDHGKIVHRPYSSCISSVGNLIGTLSSSPCQLRPRGWLSHLGLSHYIKDFAWVARPMNMLTKKDVKWQWGNEQQQVFDELKRIFTVKLVLAVLNLDKEFRVEVDTLNYTTEKVLLIKCLDNL